MTRTKLFDWLLPFWSDPGLRQFYLRYKFERPDEIARKREVCRQAILRNHRVEEFKRKQDVLWFIDSQAQRRSRRRELLAELFEWMKLPGAIGGFIAGVWAAWEFIQRYLL